MGEYGTQSLVYATALHARLCPFWTPDQLTTALRAYDTGHHSTLNISGLLAMLRQREVRCATLGRTPIFSADAQGARAYIWGQKVGDLPVDQAAEVHVIIMLSAAVSGLVQTALAATAALITPAPTSAMFGPVIYAILHITLAATIPDSSDTLRPRSLAPTMHAHVPAAWPAPSSSGGVNSVPKRTRPSMPHTRTTQQIDTASIYTSRVATRDIASGVRRPITTPDTRHWARGPSAPDGLYNDDSADIAAECMPQRDHTDSDDEPDPADAYGDEDERQMSANRWNDSAHDLSGDTIAYEDNMDDISC
jgi:hypothetical protein